ncbi:arsenate reductase [Pelagirhabdus alkalitolerans]|uniref:Arsenate reductase n=1 Tax=Pelagirhabdus alkalitolerans TaxID=1612202 RepID=A0A1G6LPW1_9BACI|nr:arsenate reductase family protein [Pelagirhabdus alkalitolerans]SDC45300.1 arsenate reductase [Pelagirhabdus alkalitolerans]
MDLYCYPKCGTCQKAKKWLDENDVQYQDLHIVNETPSKETLTEIIRKSELPIKKFFNTSGKKYREHNLKDKLPDMTDAEKIDWLASDGMLIKRPLAYDGENVTLGFKQEQFEQVWK